MSNQMPSNFPYGLYDADGGIHYANNAKEFTKMTKTDGLTDKYTHQHFPKALHGLNDEGQQISISIPAGPEADEQLATALANGWQLKPVEDPIVIEESKKPSFDAPPSTGKKKKKN